jgi:hypothetical protein
MDERRNSKTLNIEDFKVGDLVVVAYNHVLLEEPSFDRRVYGIVVEDPNGTNGKDIRQMSLFPQIPVYMLKTNQVEWHWPSYLEIVSTAKE